MRNRICKIGWGVKNNSEQLVMGGDAMDGKAGGGEGGSWKADFGSEDRWGLEDSLWAVPVGDTCKPCPGEILSGQEMSNT